VTVIIESGFPFKEALKSNRFFNHEGYYNPKDRGSGNFQGENRRNEGERKEDAGRRFPVPHPTLKNRANLNET
jgi:hypothetical protein